MKKAKVLIPSLSLLCFSAIACVTGSVAWFSSVSNAHVATTSFSVKALEGSMNIAVYHGVGTVATLADATPEETIKDGSGNIIGYQGSDDIVVEPDTYTIEDKKYTNVLTHGSFDAGDQKAYTIKPFSPTTAPEYTQVASGKTITKADEQYYWASSTKGYYHIFSFDIKFTYDFGGATEGKSNLFFDVDSEMTRATSVTGLDTAKGFRMAFYNTSTKKWLAWSDLQDKEWGSKDPKTPSHYIGEVGTTTKTITTKNYDPSETGNLVYEGDTISPVTTAEGSAARKDCLGTFDAATSGGNVITIRVVAWYEGEDPNVTTAAELNAVSVKLAFHLKGYKA